MATNQFPRELNRLIQLPGAPGPEGLASWRVAFGQFPIPLLTTESLGAADDDGYYPICAVFLGSPGCPAPGCRDVYVYVNDGLARCAVWVTQFILETNPAPAGNVVIQWRVKQALGAANTPVASATSTITFPNGTTARESGLVVEVDGALCNQFEVWARVNPLLGASAQLRATIEMIVDRLPGRLAVFPSPGPLGGGPPLPLPCCDDVVPPVE